MSYIALYRKYRPDTFENIIGQENVTKILKSQVKSGKISHAYIFSGTRGTGKTSAAKIFARAINCLNKQDGNPCNECAVCKGILDSSITDVIEMDAASNNSVDNIRQIRQEVVYATIDVKYRVYIIDEAHMLTSSAFNALLKTLEEPPENVVFILATTEQHKIPVTILSRCLRFEFGRLSIENIINGVERVLNKEKILYEKEAVEYIAKLADGALRDALSITDRCITETKEILKYEDVLRIVGAIDKNIIESIIDNIISYKGIESIEMIDQIIQKGKDLRQFVYQLTEEFLNILIKNKDETKKDRYIYIIDRLSRVDNDLRLSSNPAIILKACIIELCKISNLSIENGYNIEIIASLASKVEYLENEILKLTSKNLSNSNTQPIKKIDAKKIENKKLANNLNESNDIKNFEDIENFKKLIIQSGKIKIYSALAGAKVSISDQIVISTSNKFAFDILQMNESIEVFKKVFKENYNILKDIIVRLEEVKEQNNFKIEKILKENNINYTQID